MECMSNIYGYVDKLKKRRNRSLYVKSEGRLFLFKELKILIIDKRSKVERQFLFISNEL